MFIENIKHWKRCKTKNDFLEFWNSEFVMVAINITAIGENYKMHKFFGVFSDPWYMKLSSGHLVHL